MNLEPQLLKKLILLIEPSGFAASSLFINGYGKPSNYQSLGEHWIWNTGVIETLSEEELLNIIKELIWQ